jgi:hypothetical protein
MKKIFVFIALLISLSGFSKSDIWVIDITLYGDTVISYPKTGVDWHGKNVSVDINVKYPEDATGVLTVGGTNNTTSNKIGVIDFKLYDGWTENPITVDTTAEILEIVNESLWWGTGFNCVKGFPFDIPSFKYEHNTCDSVKLFMYWRLIDN